MTPIKKIRASSRLALAVSYALLSVAGVASAADDSVDASPDSSPLAAADAPADAPTTLDSIKVTAQKREEDLQDVASAVTAVRGADIIDAELRSTKDIAKEIPGATSWNAESRARPRFFLRGVGSNEATNNAVQPIGIYVDEVYYLNSLLLGGPLFDLDRVEVLRGPQGTLWGKNTTGGAYNFVSKSPGFRPDGYAKLGVGNYGQRLFEAAYGGPIREGVLAQRFSVHYDERDGLATNRINGEEVGAIEDLAFRYQLLANFNQDVTARITLHARKFSGDSTPTYPVTRTGIPTSDGYTSPYVISGDRSVVDYAGELVPTEVDTHGINAKVDWSLGDYTLTSISAYDAGSRETPASGSSTTPTLRSYAYGNNETRQYSQELRLLSPREDRLNWIAGAYYFNDVNDNTTASATLLPVSTANRALIYSGYRQKTESRALFGSLTYNLTERLALTAGLRYTSEKVGIDLETQSSLRTVNGTSPITSSNWWRIEHAGFPLEVVASQHEVNTWNNLGYDFTPQFQIDDNQLAYVRLSSGYRSGNYAGGASLNSQPVVVEPEKLIAYEAGYKSTWLDGRLTLNAAAYYYDYRDIQLTVNRIIDGTFRSILANAGEGEVKGVELEARARLTRNLLLRGNVSSLRTKYTELVTGTTSYAGYNFARVPNVTGLLGLDYTIGDTGIRLSTDWAYTGRHNFNITDNTDPYALQEGYWLGTVRASYEFPGSRTTLSAYVNNVTDKDYKVQAQLYSNGFYPTRLGDPRIWGVTWTTRF